jgi:hypothetical protein
VAGWSYQWASQLNWAPDSWTAPVDAVRTPPSADTTTATIEQVRQMMTMLPADGAVPTFVFAAGYAQLAASSATYECPGPGHVTLKSSLQLGPGGVASSSCGYRYSRQPTEISKSPAPSAPKGTPRPPCTRCRVIKKTA